MSVKYLESQSVRQSDTEFGDITLMIRRFWSFGHFAAPTVLSLAAGANLPTGKGIVNPISSDRNFVSGTLDPIVSVSSLFSMWGPWSATSYSYARPIFARSKDKSKAGSVYLLGAAASYSVVLSSSSGIDLGLKIDALHREKDEIGGIPFNNSGGDWVYLSPAVAVSVLGRGIHGLQFRAEFKLPLYQYVNGTQLTDDWSFNVGLSYGGHLP